MNITNQWGIKWLVVVRKELISAISEKKNYTDKVPFFEVTKKTGNNFEE